VYVNKTSGGRKMPVRHTIPLGIVIFLVSLQFTINILISLFILFTFFSLQFTINIGLLISYFVDVNEQLLQLI